MKHMNKN